MHVSITGSYLHQGFFGCQGEIEITVYLYQFANVNYSHVHNLIQYEAICGYWFVHIDEDNTK